MTYSKQKETIDIHKINMVSHIEGNIVYIIDRSFLLSVNTQEKLYLFMTRNKKFFSIKQVYDQKYKAKETFRIIPENEIEKIYRESTYHYLPLLGVINEA